MKKTTTNLYSYEKLDGATQQIEKLAQKIVNQGIRSGELEKEAERFIKNYTKLSKGGKQCLSLQANI